MSNFWGQSISQPRAASWLEKVVQSFPNRGRRLNRRRNQQEKWTGICVNNANKREILKRKKQKQKQVEAETRSYPIAMPTKIRHSFDCAILDEIRSKFRFSYFYFCLINLCCTVHVFIQNWVQHFALDRLYLWNELNGGNSRHLIFLPYRLLWPYTGLQSRYDIAHSLSMGGCRRGRVNKETWRVLFVNIYNSAQLL